MFYFDWLVQFANELRLNKCSVLKVVAKLYDPLGLISPLFITGFVSRFVQVEDWLGRTSQ